ncbi:MAG: response regulator [Planctomycetes bacterium]|nr:response regulator [Planctomycetota bacterium]
MVKRELTHGGLQEAIAIYLELAYRNGPPRRPVPAPDLRFPQLDDVLAQFHDESKEEGGRRLARYALRLGNERYPFMKFVLQEFVRPGQFYFAVDTHDEMRISPAVPDYEEFLRVRAFNRSLKHSIELAWTDRGLPTLANLRDELAGHAGPAGTDAVRRGRVLVVDDDEALAGVMEAILHRHGFEVLLARHGREALATLEGTQVDLVIVDYQMPEMDGADFCEALHAREATRRVPILLATAAAMSLAEITDKANGFLVKPYREDVLIGLIDNLLGERPDAAR